MADCSTDSEETMGSARITSLENQGTQRRRNDMDNNDTRSNGRGVTNGYAFGSDMDRLTGTPN